MKFKWVDYCELYEAETEMWSSDELTLKYAINESIKSEHSYYLIESGYVHNETYFCKIVNESANKRIWAVYAKDMAKIIQDYSK